MIAFDWLPEHIAAIGPQVDYRAPAFQRDAVIDILPGNDLWDRWPVLTEDGTVAEIAGGNLVIALTSARTPDPEDRHQIARMRLFHLLSGEWHDLGPLLPADLSPGRCEWAGSAILSPSGDRLKLFFTATGQKDEVGTSFTQRLFETEASIEVEGKGIVLGQWRQPQESVAADGVIYQTDMTGGGGVGTIKAFRDPFFYRAADDDDYLLFTASDAKLPSAWNGLIGVARKDADGWQLLPPLVRAAGLNNELERPHVVQHDGMVYLFWSSQTKVFNPAGPTGPTGLYGAVADTWGGPWRPLNGTGLVFGNPQCAPFQAYSFQVLADLSVWSFADMPETQEVPASMEQRRAAFTGGAAPTLQIRLYGAEASLVSP